MYKSIFTPILALLCFASIATQAKNPASPRHGHHKRAIRNPHRHSAAAFMGLGAVSELAFTGGVEYQRFIDQDGKLSAVLPVAAYYGGTVGFGEIDGGETRSKVYGAYVNPGIRYHPFGNEYRADLGIGAGMILGMDHRRDHHMSDYGYNFTEKTGNNFLGGIWGQISVDFHARNHPLVFGLFLSGGALFAHTETFFPMPNATSNVYALFGLRLGGQW